jgi:hypothetical protein
MSEQKTVTLSYQEHERLISSDKRLAELEDALSEESCLVLKETKYLFGYSYRSRYSLETIEQRRYRIVRNGEGDDYFKEKAKEYDAHVESIYQEIKKAAEIVMRDEERVLEKQNSISDFLSNHYNNLPWFVKLFFKKEDFNGANQI